MKRFPLIHLKMKGFIFAVLAAAVTTLTACGTKIEPEDSCNFVQNSSGQRVSWKGDRPIPLYIHESVPVEFHAAIVRAMGNWEKSVGEPLFRVIGFKTGEVVPRRDDANVIYWMNSWQTDRANEQARTTIYWIGDEIQEADVYINDKDFEFYSGSSARCLSSTSGAGSCAIPSRQVDFESLLVHELGHVLGLQHNDALPSVMATYLRPEQTRRKIGTEDIGSLRCEYN
ncbi:MAG: matrixin family metalloprotease [Bdellovibrionales bacterium]|nr:matrixin family metalloprotease [Bdellovibrionales bacterium]